MGEEDTGYRFNSNFKDNARFVLRALRTATRLTIQMPAVEQVGDQLYEVTVMIQNIGISDVLHGLSDQVSRPRRMDRAPGP